MNQKSTSLVNHAHKTTPPKPAKDDIAKIEDIKSDADTFPEFSNRDGSREPTCVQLTMVRIPHPMPDSMLRGITEQIATEMHVWKTPSAAQFAFFTAPHLPLLNLAHGVAKKYGGEKAMLRSSHFFAEPKNDKFFIAKDAEVKQLKFEVILGHSRFHWDKPETHHDIARRVESTLNEVLRVLPNVVIILGPQAFDALYETLDKQKRRSTEKLKKPLMVTVENFRKDDAKWKRIAKSGATSISAPFKH